jgi:hypothetical protein
MNLKNNKNNNNNNNNKNNKFNFYLIKKILHLILDIIGWYFFLILINII